MTLRSPPDTAKSASRRSVPSLQVRATMRPNPDFRAAARTVLTLAAGLLAALSGGGTAHAQNSTAMCTGTSAPAFNYALSVQQTASSTNYQIIAPSALQNVLNKAECECGAMVGAAPDASGRIAGLDLFLRGQVTKSLPSVPEFHVYAGTSCNASTTQTTTCDNLDSIAVDPASFRTGGSIPIQAVPVRSLVSPGSSNMNGCNVNSATNSIWFLFGPLAQPDSCYVEIDYDGVLPDAPKNPRVGSGDGAVSLNWDSPTTGTAYPPTNYQVLCMDEQGNPAGTGAYSFGENKDGRHQLGYTTCINQDSHTLQRRVLPQTSATSSADAGSSSSTDMATAVVGGGTPLETEGEGTLTTEADPTDGGDAATSSDGDAGTAGCTLSDPSVANALLTLDKRYVCSDILDGTSTTTRIADLTNNKTYLFVVVSIDKSGNARPSSVMCAKPQPVEDLWRRYLADGGKQQGFCFIATAAYGSYQSPFVMVLRDFRDQVLQPTASGAAFVEWYYRTSPPIADWIRPRPWARFLVRAALWPVIVAAGLWMWLEPGHWVLLSLLLGTWIAVRVARRRAAPAAVPTLAPARSEA